MSENASNDSPSLLPNGYVPQDGDALLLARMLFTEAASDPGAYLGLAWAAVNRIGHPAYGSEPKLAGVIHRPHQFQGVGLGRGTLWAKSATPETLLPQDHQAWQKALQAAKDVLRGLVPDPTGGATSFYCGGNPGGLRPGIQSGRLRECHIAGGFHFLELV